jgi:hypothetical protein
MINAEVVSSEGLVLSVSLLYTIWFILPLKALKIRTNKSFVKPIDVSDPIPSVNR